VSRKLLVFDLDDTLMDNVHDYSQPILDAVSYIVRVVGAKAPHVAEIIRMEQEIDKRRVTEVDSETGRPFGYSAKRFPGTLVEVYREICRKAGIATNRAHEEDLFLIGLGAFDERNYAKSIKNNCRHVAMELRARGNLLMILTKGDIAVQNRKVLALRSAVGEPHDFPFAQTRIVETNKTPEVFKELISVGELFNLEPFSAYSIGNDYDKDIVPALTAGYKGIWIPCETWETIGKMDEIRARVDTERCLIMNNLSELLTRYEEL
jgi:FMN phosphatase YigB (HAD superfamily)